MSIDKELKIFIELIFAFICSFVFFSEVIIIYTLVCYVYFDFSFTVLACLNGIICALWMLSVICTLAFVYVIGKIKNYTKIQGEHFIDNPCYEAKTGNLENIMGSGIYDEI